MIWIIKENNAQKEGNFSKKEGKIREKGFF